MNDYMKDLYNSWANRSKDTPEMSAVLNRFCNHEETDALIFGCIDAVSRQGFEAGFNTAIQLMKLNPAFPDESEKS